MNGQFIFIIIASIIGLIFIKLLSQTFLKPELSRTKIPFYLCWGLRLFVLPIFIILFFLYYDVFFLSFKTSLGIQFTLQIFV